jgi:hypothetical protein
VIAGQAGPAYVPEVLKNTIQYRRITVSTANGTSCESLPSDTVSVTVNGKWSWAGGVSGDWEVPDNWCDGVPGNNADIYIPPGITVHVTSPASSPVICRDLKVAGNLIIDAGAALTVYGELSLAGDGNLYIYNAKNMTSPDIDDGIASLITNSPVKANFQFFLDGDTLNDCMWDYFSPPVRELDVSTFTDSGYEPAQFIESLVTDTVPPIESCTERGWVSWNNRRYFNDSCKTIQDYSFNSLSVGKGYNLRHGRPTTYNFSGTLNIICPLIDLACTGEPGCRTGYNLIGNPFSCWINIGEMFRDPEWSSTVHKTVWFIRDGKWHVWANGISVPDDTYQGHIPPMQGFFVKATAGNSISLPWRKEHHKDPEYKNEDFSIPLIRLSVSSGAKADETVIRFDEKAKPESDTDFDAPRFSSSPDGPSIYTSLNGIDYVINAIPFPDDYVDIPVSVDQTTEGRYTISAMQIQGLNDYNVLLRDEVTKVHTDLKSVKEYSFSAPAGIIKDRLLIRVMKAPTALELYAGAEGLFTIYYRPGLINIVPLTEKWSGRTGSVRVLDLWGRPVKMLDKAEFTRYNLISLPSPKTGGVYLVEMRAGSLRYSGKVVVR